MTEQRYRAVIGWFNARPGAKRMLRAVSKGSVAAVYALYAGLLVWFVSGLPGTLRQLAAQVAVPAAVFLLGTALRAGINRPRPYAALGFEPLFPKAEQGKSFPSRHCFSAAAIAAAAWYASPALAAALAVLAVVVAACRVLEGHHYPGDVLAGLAFGALAAWCGMTLFLR